MTTSSFPGAIDNFGSDVVDGVTQVLADHINFPRSAIVAIETELAARNSNLLYHSLTHDIWQEGVSFADITDDTYVADLWNFIHNGQAPDVVGNAGGSTDDFARQLAVTTDSADTQFGVVQFLENKDTIPLRGKVVSMSGEVRSIGGPTVTNIRMNPIIWTGTADTVTSDVVGTWGAGNPTLATNWAYIGTPASLAVTASKTTVAVEGLTIPTNANNIGFFVWTPDLEATASIFTLQNCQLKLGIKAGTFKARSFADEQRLVRRFFEAKGGNTLFETVAIGQNTSTTVARLNLTGMIPKRISPTLTVPDVTKWGVRGAAYAVNACSALSISVGSPNDINLSATVASGLVAGDGSALSANNDLAARLYLDARL